MTFWEYELRAETLHIGERIKKGTFRPVVPAIEVEGAWYRPIPYSTALGALREVLGLGYESVIHAAGYLTSGDVETLVIAPQNHVTGVSKLPITVEYVAGVEGRLFIVADGPTRHLPKSLEMAMGGMRYKGFGLCRLKRVGTQPVEPEIRRGTLLTRIPEYALDVFGIDADQIAMDGPYRRGYLFKPTSATGGVYVRALFEGSRVYGFHFILGGGYERSAGSSSKTPAQRPSSIPFPL